MQSCFLKIASPLAFTLFWAVSSYAVEPDTSPRYTEHSDLSYYLLPDGTRSPIRSVSDWQVRRRHIIAGMEQVMGPLPRPANPVPLSVEVVEEHEHDGLVRQKLAYHTDSPDRRVTAWLIQRKEDEQERRPAMLCFHQTTPEGKDSPAGLAGRPTLHYALELARRGYITLSPDYPSFGEYSHDFDADEYESGSMKAIYDATRAVDLLSARPEVDPERIGCIGHSLGGHHALFSAVFDDRIQAVVTSCGFTRFHEYMNGDLRGWTGARYMPLIESKFQLSPDAMPFDFTEVVAALAPRGVFVVAPLEDDNFDVDGVRDVIRAAEPIYQLLSQPGRLRVFYPDGGHDFPDIERRAAYAFLDELFRTSR